LCYRKRVQQSRKTGKGKTAWGAGFQDVLWEGVTSGKEKRQVVLEGNGYADKILSVYVSGRLGYLLHDT
jgi:hypothetical protein